jgi:signal transduction histidine kinase
LVSSSLYLAVARQHTPDPADLTVVEDGIRTALDRLRSIAHGLAPEALRTSGVWAAVDSLASSAAIPVSVDLPAGERGTNDLAGTALYFGIAGVVEAATACAARSVTIRCTAGPGLLCSDIVVEGAALPEKALVDAADRLGAADGMLGIAAAEGACRVRLEVPCES